MRQWFPAATRWVRRCLLPAFAVVTLLSTPASGTEPLSPSAAQWAVDPTQPGPNRLAPGASLFDELTADGVPFPFEALLAKIDRRLGCTATSCVDAVLIPLGRSLQRVSAAPDFFASPRVVAAVTGEGDGRLGGRNRLFVGYQPRAAMLEVISYNDRGGRFEFQVVHDYRAGGHPRTSQAERTVCIACHQNHGPIFSRPLWSETNANPVVAAELRAAGGVDVARGGRWSGVDLARGVDAPNAIDDATDAANLHAVTTRLWRDACDAACRRMAVRAAIAYRLSAGRTFESLPSFAAAFLAAYPHGLAIPNPDLPNRVPPDSSRTGAMRADVPGELEALQPRAPLEVWHASDAYLDRRFVLGLASMVTSADVASVRKDVSAAFERLRSHEFGDEPLSRATLQRALGLAPGRSCCDSSALLATDLKSVAALPPAEAGFVAPCGACHATAERTPPNFLAGEPARVARSLRQCAPRIFVRLALWQRNPSTWAKVPMPPPRAADSGHPAMQSAADPIVHDLRRTVTAWMEEEGRGTPSIDGLLAQGYENLRPCLPAGE